MDRLIEVESVTFTPTAVPEPIIYTGIYFRLSDRRKFSLGYKHVISTLTAGRWRIYFNELSFLRACVI